MGITLYSGDNMPVAMSPQPATSVLKKNKFNNVLYLLWLVMGSLNVLEIQMLNVYIEKIE